MRALEVLAEASLRAGELGQAVEAARAAVALAPFRESAHRLLMEAHEAGGQPGRGAARVRGPARAAARRARHDARAGARWPSTSGCCTAGRPPPAARRPRRAAIAARRWPAPLDGRARGGTRSSAAPPRRRCCTTPGARAAGGARRLVVLAGEAGIGKTRLAAELAGHAARRRRRRPLRPLRGGGARALPAGRADAARLGGRRVARSARRPARRARGRAGDRAARVRRRRRPPTAASLRGARARRPAAAPLRRARRAAARDRRRRAAARRARRPALGRPADAPADRPPRPRARSRARAVPRHRAREEGSEALDGAARRAAPRGHAAADRAGGPRRAARPARSWPRSAAGPRTPAFVEQLHGETDGNPFFIEEVVHHLADAGGRLGGAVALDEAGVPEGVREVTGRRLARLGEPAREMLAAAAVIGREFDFDVLEEVGPLEGDELVARARGGRRRARPARGLRARRPLRVRARADARDALRRALRAAPRAPAQPRRRGADRAPRRAARLRTSASSRTTSRSPRRSTGPSAPSTSRSPPAGARTGCSHGRRPPATTARRSRRASWPAPSDDRLRCELLLALGASQERAGRAGDAGDVRGRRRRRRARSATRRCWAAPRSGTPAAGPSSGASRRTSRRCCRSRSARSAARTPRCARGCSPGSRSSSTTRATRAAARALRGGGRARAPARRPAHARRRASTRATTRCGGPRPCRSGSRSRPSCAGSRRRSGTPSWSSRAPAGPSSTCSSWATSPAPTSRSPRRRELAAALHRPLYEWWTSLFRCARAQIDGRFDEAERLAERDARDRPARAGGERRPRLRPGDVQHPPRAGPAGGGRGGRARVHRACIRPCPPGAARSRCIYLELGREDEARAEFDALATAGFDALPRDAQWLIAMTLLAEVCGRLGDAAHAAELYELLRPTRGATWSSGARRPATGRPRASSGSSPRCGASGRGGAPLRRRAGACTRRMGARPFVARTQLAWAEMELARGDVGAARERLAEAIVTADALGMGRWRRARGSSSRADRRCGPRPHRDPRSTRARAPPAGVLEVDVGVVADADRRRPSRRQVEGGGTVRGAAYRLDHPWPARPPSSPAPSCGHRSRSGTAAAPAAASGTRSSRRRAPAPAPRRRRPGAARPARRAAGAARRRRGRQVARAADRDRRARPRARRRARARLARPARRLARDRQVDADVDGARQPRGRRAAARSTCRARSRPPRSGCAPSGSPGAALDVPVLAETDLDTVLATLEAERPEVCVDRLGPDAARRAT